MIDSKTYREWLEKAEELHFKGDFEAMEEIVEEYAIQTGIKYEVSKVESWEDFNRQMSAIGGFEMINERLTA